MFCIYLVRIDTCLIMMRMMMTTMALMDGTAYMYNVIM